MSSAAVRAPWGSRLKWEACVICGSPKIGKQRLYARCRSCSHQRPKFTAERNTRPCRSCGVEKRREEFVKNKFNSDGRDTICKECRNAGRIGEYQRSTPEQQNRRRATVLKHLYGIDADLVRALYEKQEGCCAICGRPGGIPHVGEKGTTSSNLHLDHDHETGDIRGLLCQGCNVGIGMLKDSPHLLVKAAAYLGGD